MTDNPELIHITGDYSVAAQILPDDIAVLAALGFTDVICNRPDGEDPGQPTAAEIASCCNKAGIGFHHIPISTLPLSAGAIDKQRQIIENSAGMVLGYCRSGHRSTVIFQASA